MRALVYSALVVLLLMTPLVVKAQDPFSSFESAINKLTQSIMNILNVLKESAISIGRVLAGTLIALGVVLWASDIFTYKGRKLILAGIILLILMELIP
ncbi:MAG: hypothetical protein QI199_04090 [Candidatus Korarchaeota archaeon]|nr:hypothetical protein [Candidatus Korarchaeota archaeon]